MAAAAVARPQRGERLASFFPPVPEPVPSVFNIDSAFQLQEYISLLIRLDVHDVERIVNLPEKSKNGDTDGDKKTDANVDQYCWIYEQLRCAAVHTWCARGPAHARPPDDLHKTSRTRSVQCSSSSATARHAPR